MNFFKSLLPKSLTSRILAMLSILILTFLTSGLGLFYKNQLLQHIEEIQDTANMLIEVAAQAVEESVVIGDYDTIKRTLEKPWLARRSSRPCSLTCRVVSFACRQPVRLLEGALRG